MLLLMLLQADSMVAVMFWRCSIAHIYAYVCAQPGVVTIAQPEEPEEEADCSEGGHCSADGVRRWAEQRGILSHQVRAIKFPMLFLEAFYSDVKTFGFFPPSEHNGCNSDANNAFFLVCLDLTSVLCMNTLLLCVVYKLEMSHAKYFSTVFTCNNILTTY